MLCETCKKKECLVEGKGYGRPCRKVENYLERENAKTGYSLRHIRRKEIPQDNEMLERTEWTVITRFIGVKNKS
jgi:hypothetical protein